MTCDGSGAQGRDAVFLVFQTLGQKLDSFGSRCFPPFSVFSV